MIMMREVTQNAFERVLLPLGGLADDDHSELHRIDSSDETQMRSMVRIHIHPEFASLPECQQFAVKISLGYFLAASCDNSTFARPLEGLLASELNTPNPKDFYIWIWEELFPGEPAGLPGIEDYSISRHGILMNHKKPVMMPLRRS